MTTKPWIVGALGLISLAAGLIGTLQPVNLPLAGPRLDLRITLGGYAMGVVFLILAYQLHKSERKQ